MNQTHAVPFFSVVIPAYNAERYLSATFESVIAQTDPDWEIIAVDDASSDSTPALLAEYAARYPKIRIFRNEKNSGIAKTLNYGIREARGKWIVRLDTDDLFVPGYLKTLRTFIKGLPHNSCFVSGWVTVIDGGGLKVLDLRLPSAKTIARMMHFENFLYHSATSFPKEVWERVGGYPDADRTLSEDTEMWKRFLNNGISLFMLPQHLVQYRIHQTNLTSFKDGDIIEKKDRQNALWQQYHEWRVSLFLKQGDLRAARAELAVLKRDQKTFSLKNALYYFMTLFPSFVVHSLMWEIRPRLRRLALLFLII